MDPRLLLLVSALLLGATLTVSVEGRQSQCKVKWMFGIPCQDVCVRLVSQIKAWQVTESCQSEEESCSYQLVSSGQYQIEATHTSPYTHTVSDLNFLLEQSTVCKVTGEAIPKSSNASPDNSTNFCSLQNLMGGSDLISAEGYKQFSNKWICPDFDSSKCILP